MDTAPTADTVADLRRLLTEREAERDAARAQTLAMGDVLRAIAASPADPQPVFELIARKVKDLYGAHAVSVVEHDGALLHQRALIGHEPEAAARLLAAFPRPPGPDTGPGRVVLSGKPVYVREIDKESGFIAAGRALGAGSYFGVPLLHEDRVVGVLGLWRADFGAFNEALVEIAKAFAQQAVIAIAGAKTLRELRERDEENRALIARQEASIAVLKAIAASPDDPQPVFELIARKARELCGAAQSGVTEYDGEVGYLRALDGYDPAVIDRMRRLYPRPPTPGTIFGRTILSGQIVHIRDVSTDRGLAHTTHDRARDLDTRSLLGVPLLRDGRAIGSIVLRRTQVGGFDDNQIALVRSFAEQAMIAIASANSLRELRERTAELAERNSAYGERIEQQAATIDVLQAMSASPGDAQPVLVAIAGRARAFCGAEAAGVVLLEDGYLHLRTHSGFSDAAADTYAAAFPRPVDETTVAGRAILARAAMHVPDIMADPRYVLRTIGTVSLFRSSAAVPLLRDGVPIGAIGLARSTPGICSDTQMELLKTFADQAVIAITSAETWRALQARTADLRESLEYQTAASDVLRIISQLTTDIQPVLDALVQIAARLCDAEMTVINRRDARMAWMAASHGYPESLCAYWRATGPIPLDPDSPVVAMRTLIEGQIVHIHDVSAVPGYPTPNIELGGLRTVVGAPLRRGDEIIGMIGLARQRVEPFTERQIALLQNFAAQAVIAIENTRLLTEQQEALERQTAMAEVLQVINASPGDLTPVFDAILEKALRICQPAFGTLRAFDGERSHVLAERGAHAALTAYRAHDSAQGLSPNFKSMLETRRPFHMLDIRESEGYQSGDSNTRAVADLGGARTVLLVPLLKEGVVVGNLQIYRREVRAFTDNEISLLENFAAQAVIAMENARLLGELRQRTGDLQQSLEYQTATSDVLKVINQAAFDTQPVFDKIVETVARLCGAEFANITNYDGETNRIAAIFSGLTGYNPPLGDIIPVNRQSVSGRAIASGQVIQIEDVAADPDFATRAKTNSTVSGIGTVLSVPLLRDGAVIGTINLGRGEMRPFATAQIDLIRTFADQAVIAIENARLLTEQQEALEQQTATAEVLGVINANPGDLAPVFEAILDKAHTLCGASIGSLFTWDGEFMRAVATHGQPADYAARLAQGFRASAGTVAGALVDGARFVHVPDIMELTPDPRSVAGAAIAGTGMRTVLQIPLRKEGNLLGYISAARAEVRPFAEKEISLLENFAAQAVIAMENARLLTETQEALEQQTATAEVLGVINANPGNLKPVFDTILEKAHALCGASIGSLITYDGEFMHTAATRGWPEDYVAHLAQPFRPQGVTRQLVDGARFCHTPDVAALAEDPGGRAAIAIKRTGMRTLLQVPLRREDTLLGYISAARLEARPFTDKEIALLESFAAQAVIALENARLLNEVRQRQEELRITFENMGDGVAMFDAEPRLVAWNSKFQEIFAVPSDLLEQRRTYADYIRFLAERGDYGPDTDAEEMVRRVTESTGQQRVYERTRPDGRVVEIRNNPVDGGGFVLIFADITERKRNEAAIAAARDAAEEATRAIEAAYRDLKIAQANLVQAEKMASLGQLTAGIAHEIKNPLNFVNNFANLSVELLEEFKEAAAPGLEHLTDDQRADVDDLSTMLTSNLKKIEEHGKRADGIVRAMLEHSRGASGERRAVDLNALIDEALNLAYHGARAQDQSFNITLERDFAAGMAPIEVNPQDMTRVFLNLFGNGFYAANKRAKAGTASGFEPALRVTTIDHGDRIEVQVRDNGTGIPEDIRDKLFEPFFTTKPTGEGTGLGLSITYDIVTKQHGGTIAVESTVGDHTTFSVQLPRTMFADRGGLA